MDKDELKKELADIKTKIKLNSTDAHFADTLIAELLSVKGQLDHEPTLAHLPLSDIEDTLKGDNFDIYAMKTGEAVYRLKGGLTVIATNGLNALNLTLRDYVFRQHEADTVLNDDEKELYANDLMASTMILNLPVLAFYDLEFKYKIYNKILEYMVELQEKFVDNANLQDETPNEDKAFKDATLGIEMLKEELDKALKQ